MKISKILLYAPWIELDLNWTKIQFDWKKNEMHIGGGRY
jgi:hypothetical protein